jgi:predicted phosphate transport protein (TIGR00153 family)
VVAQGMWRRKREGAIQELILQHAQKVLETVQALHEYISTVRRKKPEKRLVDAERGFGEKVLSLEKEADQVEEEINEELFRGAFLPVTSSDRFDLIASIDDVADRCEIVVRKMRVIGEPIELDIKEKLNAMSKQCVDATTAVVSSIQLMWTDFDAAISKAHSVYPIREQNRIIEFETLQLLVGHEMECSTFVLLHDVIQLLGQTTDRAKMAADSVISMVIKYRS